MVLERLANRHAKVRVRLENVQDVFDDVLILQALTILARLSHDLLPLLIGRRHQSLHVLFSLRRVQLAADHVTDRFVERVHLMRL